VTSRSCGNVTPNLTGALQRSYPRFLPAINVGKDSADHRRRSRSTRQPFRSSRLNPAYGGPPGRSFDRDVPAVLPASTAATAEALLAAFAIAWLAGSVVGMASRRLVSRRGADSSDTGSGRPTPVQRDSRAWVRCCGLSPRRSGAADIGSVRVLVGATPLPALVMMPHAGVDRRVGDVEGVRARRRLRTRFSGRARAGARRGRAHDGLTAGGRPTARSGFGLALRRLAPVYVVFMQNSTTCAPFRRAVR